MRKKGKIEFVPSAGETTGCASSLISWSVETGRSELATVLVGDPRISIPCLSAPSTSSARAVTTSAVMRKRGKKRTGTWRGLDCLLSFEIDVGSHDVRTSGNIQKYEDDEFGM